MFNFGHWNRPIDADRLHRVDPLLNMCVCFAIVLNETCLVGCMLKMSLVWILKALDSCVRRTPSPCLLFCLLLLYLHLSSLLMEFKSICVSFIAALSECVKVMMLVGIYPKRALNITTHTFSPVCWQGLLHISLNSLNQTVNEVGSSLSSN